MSGVDEGDETDRTEDPTDAGTDADAGANTDPDPQTRRKPVVVVVEPETPGNVGTIARAMKNFGPLGPQAGRSAELKEDGEAYGFAGHAREDVLPNADEVTFDGSWRTTTRSAPPRSPARTTRATSGSPSRRPSNFGSR